ncbi:hypothetical protein [Streptomyces sp. NPDC048551]|uniref:hypothetical protein n=1 Tax=Streptomyces sp. NPDC048551 TaxID=3155758 RepID=UPI00344A6167
MNQHQRTVLSPSPGPMGLPGWMPDLRLWVIVIVVLVLTGGDAGAHALSLYADALAVVGATVAEIGRPRRKERRI